MDDDYHHHHHPCACLPLHGSLALLNRQLQQIRRQLCTKLEEYNNLLEMDASRRRSCADYSHYVSKVQGRGGGGKEEGVVARTSAS